MGDCGETGQAHLYRREGGSSGPFICIHCGKQNIYDEFMKGWKVVGRSEEQE